MPVAVYLRDRFVSPEEAVVSIFDRGYLLGDAVFETLRVSEARVFRLDRHVDRLEAAAAALEIPAPLAAPELASVVREAVSRSEMREAYVRITLSRGAGVPGIAFTGSEVPTLSVVVREAPVVPESVPSGIAETRRVPAACLPTFKTGSYLSNVLARRDLARRGLGEGVMLALDGAVVSGTASNVYVVKHGRVMTPIVSSGCRPGVVREALLESALGIEETALDVEALASADEIFFTSCQVGVLAASSFEGRELRTDRSRAIRHELQELMKT
jgi:branched-chain amino acid aminotransferase